MRSPILQALIRSVVKIDQVNERMHPPLHTHTVSSSIVLFTAAREIVLGLVNIVGIDHGW